MAWEGLFLSRLAVCWFRFDRVFLARGSPLLMRRRSMSSRGLCGPRGLRGSCGSHGLRRMACSLWAPRRCCLGPLLLLTWENLIRTGCLLTFASIGLFARMRFVMRLRKVSQRGLCGLHGLRGLHYFVSIGVCRRLRAS